jgi:NAD(P)-dependent dehydrogenase (short-subunit alcohol dehydrogenase family)
MSNSLKNKVFCVTGAASGIGLATVKTLLARQALVSIADLNVASLDAVYDSLENSQVERVFKKALDVADREQVRIFLDETKNHFGRVDGVVNSAGTCGRLMGTREVWEIPSTEYDLVMDVNVRGTFNFLAESLKPGFLESNASIVNIGSTASQRGIKNGAPYSTSKHAVVGLTKSVAQEVGPRGIRVNIVLP